MGCLNIPVLKYGDFSLHLHKKSNPNRIPLNGGIELTSRCNLRCVHCYINTPASAKEIQKRELSTKEVYNLIDQITDEGCLWLLLTGGEPLLRPDFLDIYSYAKRKGMIITLFTNGTTITPSIAKHLSEQPPFVVEITLYGHTQQTYERVTRVPGSYEKCVQGIELLLDHDVRFKLKTMVMTLNAHEVWDMKKYAEQIGVDFSFDAVLNMRVDGGSAPGNFRLSPQEVVNFDLADKKRMKEWIELRVPLVGQDREPYYLYECGAGLSSFHIDSFGQLSVCVMARVPSFDLRRFTFKKGWHDVLARVREQKWATESPCRNCNLKILCGNCPGFAYLETRHQEERVDYLCEIGHLRARSFGVPTIDVS
jgi:radical SAM protein with 4Fe4S-binding SPASM domain